MAQIVEEKKEKVTQKEQPKTKRKTADKWKKKAWYTIIAPEEFERKEIGETIAEKPEMLIGRIIAISGRDLANQPKKQHIKIRFKVKSTAGNKATTEAIGHIIKDDFIRRLVRRRSSKMMSVKNYTTKDSKGVKMKVVVVTEKKSSGRQRAALKKKTEEMCQKLVSEIESRKIIDELVFGTLPNKLYPELKKIVPIKRIEITNSLLL
ncbi:MAG TPA: hypothetical protein VJG83_00920 [archaeon]|nr:hypothetical protein [archaeon]